MRVLALFTIVLCGCAVQSPRKPAIASRTNLATIAQAQAIASVGESATLAWTTSEPTDCIVYSSPDKRFWSPLMRVTGTTVTIPVTPPQWFYVTSISDDGESLPSNTLGIISKAPAGLRVVGEHAPTPGGPWQAYTIPIYDGPADQSMTVFRVKATVNHKWITE